MNRSALAAVIALASVGPVLAQTAAPPSSVDGGAATGSLSSKLNKSDGVITPKANMDPGIHADAPDPHPNSTPVVPPSATGGGTAK